MRYLYKTLIFSLLISISFVGILFKWQQLRNKNNVTAKEVEVDNRDVFIQNKDILDSFLCLIDLSIEIEKFFKAGYSFNDVNENTNFQSFAIKQINSFTFMEMQFEGLSRKLRNFSDIDCAIKDISTISYNFSFLCRRYINEITICMNNPNTLEAAAHTSRIWAEFYRDWEELLVLAQKLSDNKRFFLNKKEKTIITEKLHNHFSYEINKFCDVEAKEGMLAASKLKFYNGGWLPVIIYAYINSN